MPLPLRSSISSVTADASGTAVLVAKGLDNTMNAHLAAIQVITSPAAPGAAAIALSGGLEAAIGDGAYPHLTSVPVDRGGPLTVTVSGLTPLTGTARASLWGSYYIIGPAAQGGEDELYLAADLYPASSAPTLQSGPAAAGLVPAPTGDVYLRVADGALHPLIVAAPPLSLYLHELMIVPIPGGPFPMLGNATMRDAVNSAGLLLSPPAMAVPNLRHLDGVGPISQATGFPFTTMVTAQNGNAGDIFDYYAVYSLV